MEYACIRGSSLGQAFSRCMERMTTATSSPAKMLRIAILACTLWWGVTATAAVTTYVWICDPGTLAAFLYVVSWLGPFLVFLMWGLRFSNVAGRMRPSLLGFWVFFHIISCPVHGKINLLAGDGLRLALFSCLFFRRECSHLLAAVALDAIDLGKGTRTPGDPVRQSTTGRRGDLEPWRDEVRAPDPVQSLRHAQADHHGGDCHGGWEVYRLPAPQHLVRSRCGVCSVDGHGHPPGFLASQPDVQEAEKSCGSGIGPSGPLLEWAGCPCSQTD